MAHMRTLAEAKEGIERFRRARLPLAGSRHRLGPGGLLPGDLAVREGHIAMIVGNGMRKSLNPEPRRAGLAMTKTTEDSAI